MKVTVTDAHNAANDIPARNGRKQLLMRNTGANPVYYAWESNVTASGAAQGIPLNAGEFIAFAGKDLDLNSSLKLVCAAGQYTTVNYTEKA